MILDYDIPAHIPSSAYKAFIKMALSIMDYEELKNFKLANFWIQEKNSKNNLINPLNVLFTFIPGVNPFQKTSENEKYVDCMFVIAFGNVMYQIVIPSDKEIAQQEPKKTLLKFLAPLSLEVNWFLGKSEHRVLDWSETNMLKNSTDKISFSYDKRIKLDNLIGKKIDELPNSIEELKKYK